VKAKEVDFAGWLSWCLSDTLLAGPVANYQTRVCSRICNGLDPVDWKEPVHLDSYLDAVEQLKDVSVAVYEELPTSLTRIEAELEPHFPGICLADRSGGEEERERPADLRRLLGDALYEKLSAANAYDIMLHRRFSRSFHVVR
jgi:hypothetical protein